MRNPIAIALSSVLLLLVVAVRPASAQTSSPTWTIGADAVTWWLGDSPAPVPLVSTARLDVPGAVVALGGRDINTGAQSGLRLTVGRRLGARWRLDGSVFMASEHGVSETVQSSGQPGSQDYVIPYFNPVLNTERSTGLSLVGQFSGTATAHLDTRLAGGHADVVTTVAGRDRRRLEAIVGGRVLRLGETYGFSTSSPNLPPRQVDVFETTEAFESANTFSGGEAGVRAVAAHDAWSASVTARVAAGAVRQAVDISGQLLANTFNGFGQPVTYDGAYFAQPTNIGHHARTTFAVMPQFDATIAWHIAPRLAVRGSYEVFVLTRAARAADQLSHRINPNGRAALDSPNNPVVGVAEPVFAFSSSSLSAQSLRVGVEFAF